MRRYRDHALKMDREDPLAHLRDNFYLPGNKIYLEGNSLGLLNKQAEARIMESIQEWKDLGIDGWLSARSPWYWLAEKVGAKMSKLVGAKPGEVIATGGTTQNIHTLFSAFYRPDDRRRKIVADILSFPSDLYAIQSIINLKGGDPEKDLVLVQSVNGKHLAESDFIDHLSDEVSIVWLSPVLYQSGQLLDVADIAREARGQGVLVGLDCSHSAGVVPHTLHENNIDFATWCGYKYLNGGPGSTGFLFVHEKHQDQEPGLQGWFGYKKRQQFAMHPSFDHEPGAAGWQTSTPNILSLAALDGSLDLLNEVGIEVIRKKSLFLTDFLMECVQNMLLPAHKDLKIVTPADSAQRGGHVSLQHPAADLMSIALNNRGVIVDHRPPDIIRMSPSALYSSFQDVYSALEILKVIMDDGNLEQYDSGVKWVP